LIDASEPHNEEAIEVVQVQLGQGVDLAPLRSLLSADEQARASAYRSDEARDVFTLARGLLRLELSRRLSCPPNEIGFDLRSSGKPDLKPREGIPADWRFSVSHTGTHVVLAFARGADVGIDIERLDRVARPLDIAKRYFTTEEVRALEALPESGLPRAFFAGWTRKEAVVKARGSTMAESLNTLTVDLDPEAIHPQAQDTAIGPARAHCTLTSFEFPAVRLIGAVAWCSAPPPRLRFRVVSGARFD